MTDATKSVLSANLKVVGQIKTPDDLEIHCEIEGPLEANNVTIALSGSVRGHVRANRLTVAGQLTGNFMGKELELLESGRINGDVSCECFSIAKHGVLNGKCIMTDVAPAAGTRSGEDDGEVRNLIKPIFANRRRRTRDRTPLAGDETEEHEADDKET